MSSRARLATCLFLLLAVAMAMGGCGGDSGSGGNGTGAGSASDDAAATGDVDPEVAAREGTYDEPPDERLDPDTTYTVNVETTKGEFDIVLDQEAGPIAAANFAFLVREGFYDGVPFHRVIEGFMVQAGDPTGTGTGGPGYAIEDDEVSGSYSRGTVAMANAGPDTAGSQFFIVQGRDVEQRLPKAYAIFGEVDEEGMEVVDEIASVEVTTGPNGEKSRPVEPVLIEKMELEES